MEFALMITADTMKVVGIRIKEKGRVTKNLVVEISTKVTTMREKCVEKVSITGSMAIFMTGSGLTGKNMATVCGRMLMVTNIWVSGFKIWHMGTESMSGKMGTSTKGSGAIA